MPGMEPELAHPDAHPSKQLQPAAASSARYSDTPGGALRSLQQNSGVGSNTAAAPTPQVVTQPLVTSGGVSASQLTYIMAGVVAFLVIALVVLGAAIYWWVIRRRRLAAQAAQGAAYPAPGAQRGRYSQQDWYDDDDEETRVSTPEPGKPGARPRGPVGPARHKGPYPDSTDDSSEDSGEHAGDDDGEGYGGGSNRRRRATCRHHHDARPPTGLTAWLPWLLWQQMQQAPPHHQCPHCTHAAQQHCPAVQHTPDPLQALPPPHQHQQQQLQAAEWMQPLQQQPEPHQATPQQRARGAAVLPARVPQSPTQQGGWMGPARASEDSIVSPFSNYTHQEQIYLVQQPHGAGYAALPISRDAVGPSQGSHQYQHHQSAAAAAAAGKLPPGTSQDVAATPSCHPRHGEQAAAGGRRSPVNNPGRPAAAAAVVAAAASGEPPAAGSRPADAASQQKVIPFGGVSSRQRPALAAVPATFPQAALQERGSGRKRQQRPGTDWQHNQPIPGNWVLPPSSLQHLTHKQGLSALPEAGRSGGPGQGGGSLSSSIKKVASMLRGSK